MRSPLAAHDHDRPSADAQIPPGQPDDGPVASSSSPVDATWNSWPSLACATLAACQVRPSVDHHARARDESCPLSIPTATSVEPRIARPLTPLTDPPFPPESTGLEDRVQRTPSDDDHRPALSFRLPPATHRAPNRITASSSASSNDAC